VCGNRSSMYAGSVSNRWCLFHRGKPDVVIYAPKSCRRRMGAQRRRAIAGFTSVQSAAAKQRQQVLAKRRGGRCAWPLSGGTTLGSVIAPSIYLRIVLHRDPARPGTCDGQCSWWTTC
jgi:hypothetical protein